MDQRPESPTYQPPAKQTNPLTPPSKDRRKRRALLLLIGPTVLIIGSIILYAMVLFILALTTPLSLTHNNADDIGSIIGGFVRTAIFLVGVVGVLSWLPGIIAGAILLRTPKKN